MWFCQPSLLPPTAPGFVIPPSPAVGPSSPGLGSLRRPSALNPIRTSTSARASGASSVASGSGPRASSKLNASSLLRPGQSVPGDLTRDESRDSNNELSLSDVLNESITREIDESQESRDERLGRRTPKITKEGAGIFAHLLGRKEVETGRRDDRFARQSEGGMSLVSMDKERDEDESERSESRDGGRNYGTPSSVNLGQIRGSDTPRSFLNSDSRLEALDEMTRESIFGGKGPRRGRESGASGRFSEDGEDEEGMEGNDRRR